MLKIKLTRKGKKGQALYRIIVQEAKSKRDGLYAELLGTYNPNTSPSSFTLNTEKYLSWISKGAQPTPTVKQLFIRSQAKVEPTKQKMAPKTKAAVKPTTKKETKKAKK